MIGHCKDCKYWEQKGKNWTTCEAADWTEYNEALPDDGFAYYASASDDSGLECGLKTGPYFGCIKFISKV
jgi:hypothetical protein